MHMVVQGNILCTAFGWRVVYFSVVRHVAGLVTALRGDCLTRSANTRHHTTGDDADFVST